MKRIISTVLIVLLAGSVHVYAASSFSDLASSNWAYESVNAMKERGIIEGFPDGSFKPAKKVTYGEFIKMMVSSMGYTNLPVTETSKHWSYSYYQKAVELKLFMGSEIESSKSQMDREISREMMAYMIANALGNIDIESKYAVYKSKIADITKGYPFMFPVVKVYSTGILNGYPDGTFKPKGSLTRSETAVSLGRFIRYSSGEEIAEVKQQEAEVKAKLQEAAVESFLQKTVDFVKGMSNYYQYFGVKSAQELKEIYPLVYYAILQPWQSDPLFNTRVTNIEEMHSPFTNNYSSMTYAYKNMEDIGITKIEKKKVNNPALQYKYDIDQIVVILKYANTERMNAFLVKDNKIVCDLTGIKNADGSIEYGAQGKVENKAYISILPDFDYIGFCEYDITPEVFLVKKPW